MIIQVSELGIDSVWGWGKDGRVGIGMAQGNWMARGVETQNLASVRSKIAEANYW